MLTLDDCIALSESSEDEVHRGAVIDDAPGRYVLEG